MIVHRSMHPGWRSNAFLLADQVGGVAVFVDAGAPIEPLMAKVDELDVEVTHVLLTHEHHDHTVHVVELEERYGAQLVTPIAGDMPVVPLGDYRVRAMHTPGHCEPHVTWVVEDARGVAVAAFTGDALFRGTVGGTLNGGPDGFEQLRTSVLDRILALTAETVIHAGHMESSTVAEERESNPFVLAWLGEAPVGDERVQVAGNDATLLLEGPDYDGGSKAWVRFEDGREAVVGGSMVTRAAGV